jgi:hypothetical protein
MENTLFFCLCLLAGVVVILIALLGRNEVEIDQVKLGKCTIKGIRFTPRKDTTTKN